MIDLDAVKERLANAVACAWCNNTATGWRQMDWGIPLEPSCAIDHGGDFRPDEHFTLLSFDETSALVDELEIRRGAAEETAIVRQQNRLLQAYLGEIRHLYDDRCEATVRNFTDGEELFLADISEVLERADAETATDKP